jgi:hypothetical protein
MEVSVFCQKFIAGASQTAQMEAYPQEICVSHSLKEESGLRVEGL